MYNFERRRKNIVLDGATSRHPKQQDYCRWLFSRYNLICISITFSLTPTGAALALYCALHYPEPLAGCIALSTFFPEAKLPKPGDLTNKGERYLSRAFVDLSSICHLSDIPFFQAHGEMDTILPLKVCCCIGNPF